MTVREHLGVFEANGFGLTEDAEQGQWSLTAVPFSKETTFGIKDVLELVSTRALLHRSCSKCDSMA